MTTYSHLYLLSTFMKTPMQNGLGRHVCQLQRLTIKFCKSRGDSRGVRDFIEHDLVDFAKENEGIVIYVKPRRHRAAVLNAEYLNGETKYVCCSQFTREQIHKWITLLKNQSGLPEHRLRKLWHTGHPSIQGVWNPLSNRDPALNLTEFPNQSLSESIKLEKTATEQFLEIVKNQNASSSSNNICQ